MNKIITHNTVDRSVKAAEAKQGLSPVMRRFCEIYSDHKAHYYVVSERPYGRSGVNTTSCFVAEATCHAHELGAFYSDLITKPENQAAWLSSPGIRPDYSDNFQTTSRGELGMLHDDYAAEIRGESHKLANAIQKAKQEMDKTGLKESIIEQLSGFKNKRKRFLSEHDGNWSFDRRYDACAFEDTRKQPKAFAFIELVFPINWNGGTSAETISQFAARCLCLAEVLEQAGFRVAITGEDWNSGSFAAALTEERKACGGMHADKRASVLRCKIRDADQYGDIESLAPFASNECFRRLTWAVQRVGIHYAMGCAGELELRHSGKGSALDARPIPAAPGQVILDLDTVNKLFSMDEKIRQEMVSSRLAGTIGLENEKIAG